jgi:lipopolysaccharide transport system ATP-binding protein
MNAPTPDPKFQVAIQVRHLGKAFKHYARHFARLLDWLPGSSTHHQLRWVLNDLNFQIQPGESVGIVGRNGAGKSTLLKLITGTLMPTTGQVEVKGRVAALLELGMGFRPELTGYENVRMAGQLQGLSLNEIEQCMEDILAFAEIGDALHEPLRVYSSGMLVRLAFATATAVKPDILIVDEALAVGDAYFQHKCYQRIHEFKAQGTTLLFVSHDPLAIKSLCDRALLIEAGKLSLDGSPEQVLDYYNALIAMSKEDVVDHALHVQLLPTESGVRSGSGEVKIAQVMLLRQGQEVQQCFEGESVVLAVEVQMLKAVQSLTLGFMIKDRLGNDIFGTNTFHLGLSQTLANAQPGQRWQIEFEVTQLHLAAGSYSISLAAHGNDSHLSGNYDWWDRAFTLKVGRGQGTDFAGVARMPVTAQLKLK